MTFHLYSLHPAFITPPRSVCHGVLFITRAIQVRSPFRICRTNVEPHFQTLLFASSANIKMFHHLVLFPRMEISISMSNIRCTLSGNFRISLSIAHHTCTTATTCIHLKSQHTFFIFRSHHKIANI